MTGHAADLSARWGQVLSDYTIVQPFDQLARATEVLSLTEILQRYGHRR